MAVRRPAKETSIIALLATTPWLENAAEAWPNGAGAVSSPNGS
jgi:hypothetical protein